MAARQTTDGAVIRTCSTGFHICHPGGVTCFLQRLKQARKQNQPSAADAGGAAKGRTKEASTQHEVSKQARARDLGASKQAAGARSKQASNSRAICQRRTHQTAVAMPTMGLVVSLPLDLITSTMALEVMVQLQ